LTSPQAFEIDVSGQRERVEILNAILKGERTEENIDFDYIAFLCEDYTGLDLFDLCKKATFFFHLENYWMEKRKREKLWFLGLYGALFFCKFCCCHKL